MERTKTAKRVFNLEKADLDQEHNQLALYSLVIQVHLVLASIQTNVITLQMKITFIHGDYKRAKLGKVHQKAMNFSRV